MPLFFYKIWAFLKRTIFSASWWKKHWYLPWIFLVAAFTWLLAGGRGSAAGFIKTTHKIQEEERKNIKRLKDNEQHKIQELKAKAEKKKEIIRERTVAKINREKALIKKQQELIKGDGEAINKELNDALND